MSNIEKLLLDMKRDMDSKFSMIENSLMKMEDKITKNINTNMNEKFEKLASDMNLLKIQTENQERRLDEIEKRSVQRNLVFFGISDENEPYLTLQGRVLKLIKESLKLNIGETEIECIRRIGKLGNKPRPLAVTFTTLGAKIRILKNKKMLDGTNIYIKPEFPQKILKVREDLKNQQKQELEKGNKAFIRYDKLIITEKNNKISNKRAPSSSPQGTQYESSEKEKRIINKKRLKSNNTITSYLQTDTPSDATTKLPIPS